MSEEYEIYTGVLSYKNISFTFVFDKTELRLIPSGDDKHIVEWEWKMKELRQGVFVFADPIPVGVPFLIGECNETKQKIVFIPEQGSSLGLVNAVVIISVVAYIICRSDRETINRVSFTCPEINGIHPVNKGVVLSMPKELLNKSGVVTLSTQGFEATNTERYSFSIDDKEILVHFGISRLFSTSINKPPLRMESSLIFEFDDTEDYEFIYRLWWVAREFIRFLCYRRNIFIPSCEISIKNETGKYEAFATMFLIGEKCEIEFDALKKGRFIKQSCISGHEGEILSDIVDENLYLRHLPDSYRSGRIINAARFIMITAAFEWEFRRLYPEGVKKSSKTIEAEEDVAKHLQEQISETKGKTKKIYKFLEKQIHSDPLQAEIIQMGKDFSKIVDMFGVRLYQMNSQKLDYSKMGKRLADQRNNFAHGNLDKRFDDLALLDLIYMEYVIYAMQLKFYGIDDQEIQRAINDLFHLNVAI